jgi:hypothetical protein
VPPKAVLDTNVVFSRVLHELFGRAATTGELLELIWSEELVGGDGPGVDGRQGPLP